LFFPPVYIVATHAVLYDNIRHVLFLIPLLAVVAGIALDRFDRLLLPARAQRATAWAVAGAFLAYHVGVMVALHPNQYIYLNSFVGGVPGAAERFDLDFWSNSLAETTNSLVDKVVAAEGPAALTKPYTVAVCGPTLSSAYYLPPAWHAIDVEDGGVPYDFYVTQLRAPCEDDEPAGPVIARTEKMGVPLSYARDVRPVETDDDE